MKKIAFAAAALMITAGSAFAGSNDADRPTLQSNNQPAQAASVYGASPTIPVDGQVVVAPKYNSAGYLPTDVVGATSKAVTNGFATGVAVAPSYSDSGHLPGDVQ